MLRKYLCIKDYHPLITVQNVKAPTKKPVVKKDDTMTQMGEGDSRFKSGKKRDLALYEHTLKEYSDCFEEIKICTECGSANTPPEYRIIDGLEISLQCERCIKKTLLDMAINNNNFQIHNNGKVDGLIELLVT